MVITLTALFASFWIIILARVLKPALAARNIEK